MPKKTVFYILLAAAVACLFSGFSRLFATNIYEMDGWQIRLAVGGVLLALSFFALHRYHKAMLAYSDTHTCARCHKTVENIGQNGLCSECGRLLMLHVEAAKDETAQALDTVKLITGSSMYSDSTKEHAIDLLTEAQGAAQRAFDLYSSTYGPDTEAGIEGEYQHASLVCSQITRLISDTKKEAPERDKPRPVVRATVLSSSLFPVAGVTYCNEDGSSRQEILCDLCDGEDEGEAEARLVAYKYKGSPAVRVETSLGAVGNIRKEYVAEVSSRLIDGALDATLLINTFENDKGETIYRADVELED